jgi:hypothetical protein
MVTRNAAGGPGRSCSLCAHTSLDKEEKPHAAGALGQLQLFLPAHVCISTQQGECSALMVVLWCTRIQACSRLP